MRHWWGGNRQDAKAPRRAATEMSERETLRVGGVGPGDGRRRSTRSPAFPFGGAWRGMPGGAYRRLANCGAAPGYYLSPLRVSELGARAWRRLTGLKE